MFTCPKNSTGEMAVKAENLIRLLEVSLSPGLWGHPSILSGDPPSMSLPFAFVVFPSETLVICIKPTCSL